MTAPAVSSEATAAAAAGCLSRFESIGLALPEQRLTTADLMAACRHRHGVDLERLTGIHERRVCGEGEDSFSLAVDAAWDCLAHSRHAPEDIEMVVSCSITNYKGGLDYCFEPSFGFLIKEAIGAERAIHFDVRNACAGMMTGVHILDEFIRRGVVRRGMVVSGEYITSIARNATRDVRSILSRQLASLTVGDAGAAVILERTDSGTGILSSEFATYAEHDRLCVGVASRKGPGAAMFTRPRKLHRVAIDAAHVTVGASLEKCGLSMADIDVAIPHQTSKRAIRAGTKEICPKVGGEPKHVVYNLEDYGNTASTTHFVALRRYLDEQRIQSGDRVLLMVFASGVVCGSLVFTMDELRENYGRPD